MPAPSRKHPQKTLEQRYTELQALREQILAIERKRNSFLYEERKSAAGVYRQPCSVHFSKTRLKSIRCKARATPHRPGPQGE